MLHERLSVVMTVLCLSTGIHAESSSNSPADFSFQSVREMALHLSRKPYQEPPPDLSRSLRELDYDGYGAIQYKHDRAVWNGEGLPFRLEFFHRGYLYRDRVDIHLVEEGEMLPVEFEPNMFQYNRGEPEDIAKDLGFAGLRIVADPKGKAPFEAVSFLGASYFRSVPLGGVYGASARGIAVNTAVTDTKEEFPAFRKFWVFRPQPDAEVLVVFALLDGPSLTGAYRFDINPGQETVIRVRSHLYVRSPIKLGLAPLTSMFLYGEDRDPGPGQMDHRPEVHDSDGLLLHMDPDQWLWRPLRNPRQNRLSSFAAGLKLHGFGLLQRDRMTAHYADPRTDMEQRPSIWIEPIGQWPKGRVELYEMASNGEGMDNIVAHYIPDGTLEKGMDLALGYRLRFYVHDTPLHQHAQVVRTLRKTLPDGKLSCSIDFASTELLVNSLEPRVTAEGGEVHEVRSAMQNGIYRVNFLVSPKDESTVVELRASLQAGEKMVSEIWSDQWNP